MFLGYSNSHKGFKCLDPSEGRVYISRDVVFDETVFPFASLHPNAGARLRAELKLLPDILLNPSMNFGDALIHDQHLISPKPTDACSSSSTCTQPAGTNSDSNGDQIGENMDAECPYFMCCHTGSRTHSQGDLPVIVRGSASGSTSGSVQP